jgi:sulfite exporter TauE/SafE
LDHQVANQTLELAGFFTLGLLGGFGHCVAMCSPFVLFVSRRYGGAGAGFLPRRRAAVFAVQAWYTAGRISTYAVLGAVAGALGGAVQLAAALVGVRRGALLLAGALLVVWAAAALADLSSRAGEGTLSRITSGLGGRVPGHPFALGLFLGLLPCGFLYSAVVAAVSRGGPGEGASALVLFGLGTSPALLGVSLADAFIARNRAFLNRLAQLFILAMGAWFLWRGLAG